MSRCLLVSNRLPISVNVTEKRMMINSGGLVSAIRGLNPEKVGFQFEWMGIITNQIEKELINQMSLDSICNMKCHPLYVDEKVFHDYYNLYCNNVLWPLFHYERSMVRHNQEGWKAYCEVNQIVAEAIMLEAKDDDIIWIHDFHFFLVPMFIKEKRPLLKVGFFLHIPFPSSEIFRELPQRKEILNSLVLCDQIGFHDLSYLNHFRSSVQRVLGGAPPREEALGVYPISIDSEHFYELAQHGSTLEFLNTYQSHKKQMRWILGVDRLDYIKGLPLKLSSYKSFLKKFPEEHKKIQLVQIIIPSRIDVLEYRNLKEKIEQTISSINGEFGTPNWAPIQYMFKSVTEFELSALYQLSDVLQVSSRRDGMNLVSLEYVMSQSTERPGVVLLSEFAGAHSTLSYAMSINPWNIQETALKMKEALHHPLQRKKQEIKSMQNFLFGYNSSDWAKLFLRDLLWRPSENLKKSNSLLNGHFPWMNRIKSKKILMFLDFDGTLSPIASQPKEVKTEAKTIEILQLMNQCPNSEFVIISGRDKEFLEEQFIDHELGFRLAACHGAYSFCPKDHTWINLIPSGPLKWKENVLEIFDLYTKRTPGSFIEDKGHAITWHYRQSPREFADFLATKLFYELEEHLANSPVQITRGKKIIEVKSMNANKGFFVQNWIQNLQHKPDIVLAVGDDATDEDMFSVLQGRNDIESFCIKVGKEKSLAHFHIDEQREVNLFLENLLKVINSK